MAGAVRRSLLTKAQFAKEDTMKTWMKPQVREQEVGLEVTSYLPAEIDII
jgi:coenzyme PQQ precursor peptide PqqA